MRDVFGADWPPGACPDCPDCGAPPALLVGPQQAFCATDGCPVLAWNPALTVAGNRATRREIDLLDLGDWAPDRER